LLQFWLKYNLLEDAIRYLINQYSIVGSQTPNNNNNNNLLSTNVDNNIPIEQQQQQQQQQQLVALFIELILHVVFHNNLKQFHQIIHKIGTF
jgi:hypothetical protein